MPPRVEKHNKPAVKLINDKSVKEMMDGLGVRFAFSTLTGINKSSLKTLMKAAFYFGRTDN